MINKKVSAAKSFGFIRSYFTKLEEAEKLLAGFPLHDYLHIGLDMGTIKDGEHFSLSCSYIIPLAVNDTRYQYSIWYNGGSTTAPVSREKAKEVIGNKLRGELEFKLTYAPRTGWSIKFKGYSQNTFKFLIDGHVLCPSSVSASSCVNRIIGYSASAEKKSDIKRKTNDLEFVKSGLAELLPALMEDSIHKVRVVLNNMTVSKAINSI